MKNWWNMTVVDGFYWYQFHVCDMVIQDVFFGKNEVKCVYAISSLFLITVFESETISK